MAANAFIGTSGWSYDAWKDDFLHVHGHSRTCQSAYSDQLLGEWAAREVFERLEGAQIASGSNDTMLLVQFQNCPLEWRWSAGEGRISPPKGE